MTIGPPYHVECLLFRDRSSPHSVTRIFDMLIESVRRLVHDEPAGPEPLQFVVLQPDRVLGQDIRVQGTLQEDIDGL